LLDVDERDLWFQQMKPSATLFRQAWHFYDNFLETSFSLYGFISKGMYTTIILIALKN